MSADPPPLPWAQRPTGARVIGILFMVFGGLGLFGSVIGGLGIAFMARVARETPGVPDITELLATPQFSLLYAAAFVQSVVVVAGGFGLWTMKPWGRKAGEFAAWAWLVTTLGGSFINYQMADRWTAFMFELEGQSPPPGIDQFMQTVMAGSIVFNILIYGGLLGWAIVYLRKPAIRSAYGG